MPKEWLVQFYVILLAELWSSSQRSYCKPKDTWGSVLPLLTDAFNGTAHFYDFLGKLGFTVLSLGAGYQGGEVTPLFEIGATLGAALAPILHVSIPFLAALGFIGVFSGATNTPIACFVMEYQFVRWTSSQLFLYDLSGELHAFW